MNAEPLTYTPLEAAHLLGMSRNQIYIAIKDGDIPARKLGGKVLIPRARLHAWLDAA
jgi:excisionase family DNA binding protein